MGWHTCVLSAALAVGCTVEPIAPPTPADCSDAPFIEGGGATGSGFIGSACVYVVDADTGQRISLATVQMGDGPPETTGIDGVVLVLPGSEGFYSVTVRADSYVTTTWDAVAGEAMTIPMEPKVVPTARAQGTIDGWSVLPAPADGHYTLAVVRYSETAQIDGRENRIFQSLNTCRRPPASGTCAWKLTTRTGLQLHYATIVDGDEHGTPDDETDDTFTLIGYAVGEPVTLWDGDEVIENLAILPDADLIPLSIGFPAAPEDLAALSATPVLDLGDVGRLPLALPQVTPDAPSTRVLPLTIGWHTGAYRVIATATADAGDATPYAAVLGGPDGVEVALPDFFPPVRVSSGVGTHCTSGCWWIEGCGDSMKTVLFSRDGVPLWRANMYGIGALLRLPAGPVDLLGEGPIDVAVTSLWPGELNNGSFSLTSVETNLSRRCGATMSELAP